MYEVLRRVCVIVEPAYNVVEQRREWRFRGGCYLGYEESLMEPAKPNKVYSFDNVELEVRTGRSPKQQVIKDVNAGPDIYYVRWVSSLCFWLCGIGFAVVVGSVLALRWKLAF